MSRKHTLTVSFNSRQEVIDFCQEVLPEGAALFEADALDPEVKGRASNVYVIRSATERRITPPIIEGSR